MAEQSEYTAIGNAVNRASRLCNGAKAGDVLISQKLYQHVWQMVEQERVTIDTKHEGPLMAHRIQEVNWCSG